MTLWWLYFHIGLEQAARQIAQSRDPGRVGRMFFTYVDIPIIFGILIDAAATEFILARPNGPVDLETAIAILDGPAVFLLGT